MPGQSKDDNVRFAVGAGNAYTLDTQELSTQLDELYLRAEQLRENRRIKALIVPGIGYQHVLEILLNAYKHLVGQKYDEIFLLSDPILHKSERVSFDDSDMWETPLGMLETSHRIVQIASSDDHAKDLIRIDNSIHQGEISIETQLPILQKLYTNDVRILPMMVGDVSHRIVGGVLEKFLDDDDLIICVSQLSRGYPENYAVEIDDHLRKVINNMDLNSAENAKFEVTAPNSLRLLMYIAKLKKWKISELEYQRISISESRIEGFSTYLLYE